MMMFRKTKTLSFDDGDVEVRELSAGDLLDAEMNGLKMDMSFFFERCVGVDIYMLSPAAHKKIAEAIVELHPSMFSEKSGDDAGVKKK